jgi:hypothetical protein
LIGRVTVAAMTGAAVYLQRVDGVPFPLLHNRILPDMTGAARGWRAIGLRAGTRRDAQRKQSDC